MTSDETMLQRRSRVSSYARSRLAALSDEERGQVQDAVEKYKDLASPGVRSRRPDLGDNATPEEIDEVLHRMGKSSR